MRVKLAGTPCDWQAGETQPVIPIPIKVSIGVAVYQEHRRSRDSVKKYGSSFLCSTGFLFGDAFSKEDEVSKQASSCASQRPAHVYCLATP